MRELKYYEVKFIFSSTKFVNGFPIMVLWIVCYETRINRDRYNRTINTLKYYFVRTAHKPVALHSQHDYLSTVDAMQ